MTDVIESAAKAMFGSIHGYHVDLNWDNASPDHRELYLKLARISDPVFRNHYDEQYWVDWYGSSAGWDDEPNG